MRRVVGHPEQQSTQLRSWPSNVACALPWLFVVALGVLGTVNVVFGMVDTQAGRRPLLLAQNAVLIALLGLLSVRALRRGVSSSAAGITVRKTFRTRRYGWRSIEQFESWDFEDSESGVAWAFAEMHVRKSDHSKVSTKRLPLGGGPFSGDGRIARLASWVANLNRELEHRRTAP
jgi:hypothetical protein